MNEAQMNGTQADETQADRTLDGDTLADGSRSDGPDVEKLRRLRLSGFLRELVRAEGRMEAAELLGVAYRTLVKAEESGEITGRMSDALERLLGTGDDPEVARLRELVGTVEERVEGLEGGMEALAKELRDGLQEVRADVAGKTEEQAQDGANGRTETGEQAQAEDGAGRSETRAAPPVAGLGREEAFQGAAVRPGDRDREPCRGRRRGLRPGVAAGGGVADAAGRPPSSGQNHVVARDGGAAARAGAGDAGGARADAAP